MTERKPRKDAAEHGMRSKYRAGCRCTPCVEANRWYAAQWRRQSRKRGYKYVRGIRLPKEA